MLAVTLAGAVLAACQVNVNPPVDPGQIALQRSDVPSDLRRCPSSGSIDTYLKRLAVQDPGGHASIQEGWRRLQTAGAVQGAMTVYSDATPDCLKEPGAGTGRLAATVVARFNSDRAGASAYPKGAMGVPTPGRDEEEPGLQQGVGTQLSPNSWLLQREVGAHVLDVAYWQRKSYTIFFVGQDLDGVEVSRALVAVDGRAD
jgi:hypothetical protein